MSRPHNLSVFQVSVGKISHLSVFQVSVGKISHQSVFQVFVGKIFCRHNMPVQCFQCL